MLSDDGISDRFSNTENHPGDKSGNNLSPLEPPLRLELFSHDHRRERGRILAQEHHLDTGRRDGDKLLTRLLDNGEALRAAHRKFVDDVTVKKPVPPVAEWLVDNYYVVEEQISLASRHLPRKYLLELPRLADEGMEGIPRVYDIAERIIAYGDSRVDVEDVSVIVSAYQDVAPLKLGELWALPIMLRLALVENMRRMAVVAEACRDERDSAWRWAERIIAVEEREPKNLVLAIADMARANPPLTGAFVAEFKRKLQGRGSGMKMPLQWVEQNLNERNRSLDQVVADENHAQAVLEISMRNCVSSLRGLNVTDWNEFVETMSVVERTLRDDPADVYARMDFATRDEYRRVVEKLARKSGRQESEVAEACLRLAREARETENADDVAVRTHVGYYLVGAGEPQLAKTVGYRAGVGDYLRRASSRGTLTLYLGAIAVLTALFTALTVMLAHAGGVREEMLATLTFLLAFANCHIAVGLVNLIATQLVRPRDLPRIDYHKGIPPEMRTLVVVPTLLTSLESAGSMLRNLEAQYLNNRGDNIHFGLLTDFADAPQEEMEGDKEILEACADGIEELNARYPEDGGDNFFLFHRPRLWNPGEGVWMGRERKRGKLEDLNRYLLGKSADAFSIIAGKVGMLENVRYVVTLDADTAMARDSAAQLVGAMAHPLNRPHYDESLGRVTRGHGILQPRVDARLTGANRSRYARMTASEIGIDPYTRSTSDVYQDLFGEGSFIGKGIYDVEIIDRALGGRFPDNRILSHDLLEGCVVRSGLISDVKFYEDPPATYLMDMDRRHRWIRGDWQIARFLFGGVGGGSLGLLSRWKIFDNLRRSLTPVFLFLLAALALVALTNPALYLLFVLGVFLIPALGAGLCGLVRFSPDKTVRQHLRTSVSATAGQAGQMLFRFSCLPFEALVCADAIVRSLWRQGVSRKLLLQWKPADNSHRGDYVDFRSILARMWFAPASALAMMAVLSTSNRHVYLYAAPLFMLWLLSPWFAHLLSVPRRPVAEALEAGETAFLRRNARRIWQFFLEFVTAGENWLPPDNHQEHPVERTAHRTSPTNIGLSLLANLSAWDFGYIGPGRLLERTRETLAVMNRLERHRGHFYNWYDTLKLSVLHPAYISTVDSGNLAAHLLVLASGLRELGDAPAAGGRTFAGLADTVGLALEDSGRLDHPLRPELEELRGRLEELAEKPPSGLTEYWREISALTERLTALAETGNAGDKIGAAVGRWLAESASQCRDAAAEIRRFTPWAEHLAARPGAPGTDGLDRPPTLAEIAALDGNIPADAPDEIRQALAAASAAAKEDLELARTLADDCERFADIDFDFLYDKAKRLLSIGYHVEERKLDNSYYDLLASEARLAAYLGVAQGKLPQRAWFALGRMLTLYGRYPVLVSWSGSMFEYLMPLLVMPGYEGTLLDETHKACVAVQIGYARERDIPWGVSESGYNVFDSERNYQYRAFGVPELGLKHGLSEDMVVAPYATLLSAMVSPKFAVRNLERLATDGFLARLGFYEAIDYTPSRLPRKTRHVVVRSHMAHHQGMGLVALGQTLLNRPMHARFLANPRFAACAMLLQEMVPSEKALYYHSTYSPEVRPPAAGVESPLRVTTNPDAAHPEVQLLSNGNYHVMITAAGGGYSRWRGYSVTRWREDSTRDNWGAFCYLRDIETGSVWSNTHQPVRAPFKRYEAVFSEGKAEFTRRDGEFSTQTEVVVSPEDDVEVRRIRVTNLSARTRTLDVTSCAEVALAPQAADDSHQAFSKLCVQSRIVRERQALVFTRRPNGPDDRHPSAFHMLAVRGTVGGMVSYETDRLRFLGRDRDAEAPEAIFGGERNLSDSEGSVLDPVAAIRSGVSLEPGGSVIVDLISGVGEDEAKVAELLEKYQDQRLADKCFDLAWSHGQLVLRQLSVSESDARRYCRLAGPMIYANPTLRADPAILARNHKGQSGLWGYAISGDLPILLLKVLDSSRLKLVKQLIAAHTYWRLKGFKVDLVIWNEDPSGYRQALHDQIVGMAVAALEEGDMERPGGIFLRSADRVAEEDRVLIQSVARAVLVDSDGMLDEQLRKIDKADRRPSGGAPTMRSAGISRGDPEPAPTEKLIFENGYGGFSHDGTEYVVAPEPGVSTPLPWVNVLANEKFGSVVSASGASYTWAENAHGYRLTPWANDPVSDGGGEALYLRDEQTGDYWSPTPFPCRSGRRYVTRHGFGYTVFEHNRNGIRSELTVHVDKNDPVKFLTLRVANRTGVRRTLSATAYVEWVLGDLRGKTAMHVSTGIDSRSGALFAGNGYNDDFRDRVAFLDVDDPARTVTGDRREFLGRNGGPANPAAMRRQGLSGRVGAGMDPCGAMRTRFALGPGQERTLVFRLGAATSLDEARELVDRVRGAEAARVSFADTRKFWRELVQTIRVETPDPAFNFMVNGWLPYQVLACRFWGRSATYQSGGAIGYRDQLQDSMALLYAAPHLARRHLLDCAAHQFPEGDVLHWWHPPVGRGVRTLCSDDYLWLAFVAERYVAVTGDAGVLDENVGFIEGRPLREDEESYYDLPHDSGQKATLYEHCQRAIRHGLRFGVHGLPLIGSGDWNDGMDRVGREGRGESVWLGLFLHSVLTGFIPLAAGRGDAAFADECRRVAGQLAVDIEKNAWDGDWYRRAYFDDGTPLGSSASPECVIDSLPQSWSVLSGVGEASRAARAMREVELRLVDREHKLIRLFTPPFDSSSLNPGYIKGYVPGVRENGGQYTHAAIWAAMAYAALGDAEMAWEMQELLNPVNHALTAEWVDRYKVEPYVVSADIYANPLHAGRGGWSWYTGSASWLYRFMLESILGFDLRGGALRIAPCVPEEWKEFRILFRLGDSSYDIRVSRAPADKGVCAHSPIAITGEAGEHVVEVCLPAEEKP